MFVCESVRSARSGDTDGEYYHGNAEHAVETEEEHQRGGLAISEAAVQEGVGPGGVEGNDDDVTVRTMVSGLGGMVTCARFFVEEM